MQPKRGGSQPWQPAAGGLPAGGLQPLHARLNGLGAGGSPRLCPRDGRGMGVGWEWDGSGMLRAHLRSPSQRPQQHPTGDSVSHPRRWSPYSSRGAEGQGWGPGSPFPVQNAPRASQFGGTRLGKGAPAAARALGAAHPAHPVHPVHPTHTEHPEQPAYPVHPAQLGLLTPSTFPYFSITPLPGTVQNPPAPNAAPRKLLFPSTKCVRSPGPGATSARRTIRSDSRIGPSSWVPSRHDREPGDATGRGLASGSPRGATTVSPQSPPIRKLSPRASYSPRRISVQK